MATANVTGFPLIEVPLCDPDLLQPVARALLDRGMYTTLAPYPGVPRDEVGFRIQVTAANTDAQIDALLDTLTWLQHDFGGGVAPMRTTAAAPSGDSAAVLPRSRGHIRRSA